MAEKLNTAILGASGYTGAEAVRLLLGHPNLHIGTLTANRHAGSGYAEIFPHLAHFDLPEPEKWQHVNWDNIDIVFSCLPHGASEETIAEIAKSGARIIDLSADFRLKDADLYERTYLRAHTSPELLEQAVYGLTEYARDELKGADLVACPGCYPTVSLLALLPAMGMIDTDNIVIDAKSGVSGAGRKESTALLHAETAEGAHAYGVTTHRHAPEIDQILSRFSDHPVRVSFTPHLLPMNRGMIANLYLRLTDGVCFTELRKAYETRYENEPFVFVEPEGVIPHTRHVRASNQCRIGLFEDRVDGRVLVTAVIDNLTKGSSGQAVQNLNVMMGWPETLGLVIVPVFP